MCVFRFCPSRGSLFSPPSLLPQAADAHLATIVADAVTASALGTASEPNPFAEGSSSGATLPWFDAWAAETLRLSVGAPGLGGLDAPCASLYLADSTDPGAVAELQAMAAGDGGSFAPSASACLLLHVTRGGDPAHAADAATRAEANLAAARAALGAGAVYLASIHVAEGVGGGSNSAAGTPPPVDAPPRATGAWTGLLPSGPSTGGAGERPPPTGRRSEGAGAALAAADVAALREVVAGWTARALVPALEANLRSAATDMAARRRGLGSRMRSLLLRAGGGNDTNSTSPAAPPAGPDPAARRVVDIALLLRDWDTAAATAKAMGADAKSERDERGAADVDEARGLALALAALSTPPSPSDASVLAQAGSCFRDAVARRLAPGRDGAPPPPSARASAVRAALLAAGAAASGGAWADAHAALMRAAAGDGAPLRAGLLLEAAAGALLALRPRPAKRKAAFTTILAGLRYGAVPAATASAAPALAAAAYRRAAPSYAGAGWARAQEHVRDVLARGATATGDTAAAAAHLAALLPAVRSPPEWQAHYLAAWAAAAKGAAGGGDGKLPPPDARAPVPTLGRSPPAVAVDGPITWCGPLSRDAPPASWAALDTALGGHPRDDAAWRRCRGGGGGGNTPSPAVTPCVTGETVTLTIELGNPMAVPLQVDGVRLVAAGGGVVVEAAAATLPPHTTVSLPVTATPTAPGPFSLTTVEWTLCGVRARAPLAGPRGPRRAPSRAALSETTSAPQPPAGLAFHAVPPLPRVTAALTGLPRALPPGGIARATLTLANVGAVAAARVAVALPGRGVAMLPHDGASGSLPLTLRLPAPAAPPPRRGGVRPPPPSPQPPPAVWEAAPEAVLPPGATATYAVWVQAPSDTGGGLTRPSLDVCVAARCAPAGGGAPLHARTRAAAPAAPGVSAAAAPLPAAGPHPGWLVRVDARCADGAAAPTLVALRAAGGRWRVAAAGAGAAGAVADAGSTRVDGATGTTLLFGAEDGAAQAATTTPLPDAASALLALHAAERAAAALPPAAASALLEWTVDGGDGAVTGGSHLLAAGPPAAPSLALALRGSGAADALLTIAASSANPTPSAATFTLTAAVCPPHHRSGGWRSPSGAPLGAPPGPRAAFVGATRARARVAADAVATVDLHAARVVPGAPIVVGDRVAAGWRPGGEASVCRGAVFL